MPTANPYCTALGIEVPTVERAMTGRDFNYYSLLIAALLCTPLLLGSAYGILFGLLIVLLVARRAVLEERSLRQELDGYDAYMSQVKYRFIPHLW